MIRRSKCMLKIEVSVVSHVPKGVFRHGTHHSIRYNIYYTLQSDTCILTTV